MRPHPQHPSAPRPRRRSIDRLAELVLELPPERRAVLESELHEQAEDERREAQERSETP